MVKNVVLNILGFLKKRWYVFIIIIAIGGFFFYRQHSVKAQEDKETAYVVKKETLKETLTLAGNIDAEEKAQLQFQSSGRLAWVGVKEGDYVQKYQGIASLDQRELQMRLEKYLNTFSKTRWQFDQTKDDNRDEEILGLTEDQRRKALRLIDQSQFDLNNAVLDVELQALAKEYTYLYTPIEGIVTKAAVTQPGVNIMAAQTQYEVINPKTSYFSAIADQTEVVTLWQNQEGTITFDAFPDKTTYGRIKSISYMPKQDESGTVYEVKITFENATDPVYRMGMTGDIEFTLNEVENAITVPFRYVITEGDDSFVWKQVGEKREKVKISVGKEYDGVLEVKSGLQEGDVIYEAAK